MRHLVLYDGVCGLCNWAVRLILKRDPHAIFSFASIQSNYGQDVLAKYGYTSDSLDSFVLLTNQGRSSERFLTKSDAALRVVKELGGLWRLLIVFRVFPRPIRNWLYGVVARNRYRWFGKYDTCPVHDPKYNDRFLD